MKRTTVFAAAAGTVLAVAGLARWTRRGTPMPDGPIDLADLASPWGELPCPPLREGVGHLHDWLMSGDWSSPTDVLDALREQAPVRLVADLLRDLQTDLHAANYTGVAAQLHDAEQLLLQAAEQIGEADYDTGPDHAVDCPGGCGGTGEVMEIMTWDDQGEGIFVPVHQEPADCRAGEPAPAHGNDCECHGSGYTFEGGYRHLCFGLSPLSAAEPPVVGEDPWASAPPF